MIILASQSPRRQALMQLTGLAFTVRAADVDETMDPALPAAQEACRVSQLKARTIAADSPDALVIAADTIVLIDGQVLGKPRCAQQAAQMLRQLSGRTHEVVTALSVFQGQTIRSVTDVTRVTFRPLTDAEIAAYIATGEPMDKAGSYGIQGYGSMFVSHLDGDYFSVMGLPLCPLCALLREFGVKILAQEGPV